MKTVALQLSQLTQRLSVAGKGRAKHIRQQIKRIEDGPDPNSRRPQPRFIKVEEEFRGIYAELNRRRIENTESRAERRSAKRGAGG